MRQNVIVLLLLFSSLASSQGFNKPKISVKELPPYPIPKGTCTASYSSFLGVVEKDVKVRGKLTPHEIGDYVSTRLSEGYSVVLYPQPNERIFATEQCESGKH